MRQGKRPLWRYFDRSVPESAHLMGEYGTRFDHAESWSGAGRNHYTPNADKGRRIGVSAFERIGVLARRRLVLGQDREAQSIKRRTANSDRLE